MRQRTDKDTGDNNNAKCTQSAHNGFGAHDDSKTKKNLTG